MCGALLKRLCPDCHFANPLNYRYCGNCSFPLVIDAEPALPAVESVAELAPGSAGATASQANGNTLPLPPPLPTPLEGERRQATVILADVAGSTDLLDQIGSEAWVGIMNRALQIMEAEIYRFGGEVDQFRGDGLVALFGATVAHEDDPERAALAALAMQEAIKPYAADLARRSNITLQLRVGVNTGEVIITRIGNNLQHREDTAMGEAVALAARMETAAEPGTILVSQNTYELVQSLFEWQSLGQIHLKGIRQPTAVYRPLAPLVQAAHPHRLHAYGFSTTLIGRELEFQVLESNVKDLETGRGGIVLVTGEEGIGKSLLVNEVRGHVFRDRALLAELSEHEQAVAPPGGLPPPLTWLQGRCRSYEQSWPYSMWLDMLRGWLGVRWQEPRHETRDRLHHQAWTLWGERMADYYPYLATLLSLPLEDDFAGRVKHLDAAGLRQQSFLAIRSWVEAMTQQGPLVLVFNDVHWADATSLDLLDYCLSLCDHVALLWLLIFRTDRRSPAWKLHQRVETEYPHRVTILKLPALTETQSSEMINQMVGPDVLPAATRALILHKAEGNPYYIAELIKSLIEQGVLIREEETVQWQATRDVVSLDLPDSLQTLLLSRIDSLAAEERRVLQMAATIGYVFWSNVLEALVGNMPALKNHLTALQRAQLIRERGYLADLGMEYTFHSHLVRDVTYDTILSTQRLRYHRQVAEYLELQFGRDVPTQYYGILAYHYQRTESRGKELFYTRLAAQQAQAIYANAEALDLYTRALSLLDDIEAETTDAKRLYAIRTQRFEVLNGRREVLYLMGDLEACWRDAEALLHLARQLDDDPTWLIDALLQQPGVSYWTSVEALRHGLVLVDEALNLAQQRQDHRRTMQCLYLMSRQRHFLRDPAWETTAEQAFELAQQLDDRRYQVLILTLMGTAYGWSNEPQRGLAYLEAALPICRALDDRITEVHLLNQIGLQVERQGDYCRLLTEYQEKALAISREISYRNGEGDALIWCGQTRAIYLGDYESGLPLLEQARAIFERLPVKLFPILRIIQALVMQGHYRQALEALETAQRVREQDLNDIGRAVLRLVSAMLYNALNDESYLGQALELTTQVVQILADNPTVTRQYEMAAACQAAVAHMNLARLVTDEAQRQMHHQQALHLSQTALDIYHASDFAQIIECVSEEILFRHSQVLAANGRYPEAADYLQLAHDEMMRKHSLIAPGSPFSQTYLENIPLHRDIRTAYAAHLELAYEG